MDLILKILKSVPLFETLTDPEDKAIIEHITMQFYPPHYSLFKKGDEGDAMYIIKSGTVQLEGVATINEGEFFGEMALIESAPRMTSAETLSDCEIFILKKTDFVSLVHANPEIARKIQSAYESRKMQNSTLGK